MTGYRIENAPGVAEALNQLAREDMKLKLMLDIRTDIEVCKLEGWDYGTYLQELKGIIDGFLKELTDDTKRD